MQELFGHPRRAKACKSPGSRHRGRAIVLTTTREHAELKRDQIHAYGKDRDDREVQGLDVGQHRTVPEECFAAAAPSCRFPAETSLFPPLGSPMTTLAP